ncbi:MAG: LCP family protein [Candidatus Peregrinibacteria bacterium]
MILKAVKSFWTRVFKSASSWFVFRKPSKEMLLEVTEKIKDFSLVAKKEEEEKVEEALPYHISQKVTKRAPVVNFEAVEEARVSRSWKMMLLWLFPAIALIVFLVFQLSSSLSFSSLQQKLIVSTLGEDLPMDKHGLTNILILGIGGKGHSGENLTDTIILMSIDSKTHSVSMISLPRDLYISYKIEKEPRAGRINEVFRDGISYWRAEKDPEVQRIHGMEYMKNAVTKITGYEIQRFVVVDFHGFVELVDAMGGVTVNVDKRIYDSSYPTENYGEEIFKMEPGVHQMDGETALKFVRSRHNSSDFERSRRQKQLIAALKEEALEKGVLTSPPKIRQFLTIIEQNFWSDLSWQEMISLGAEVSQVSSNAIFAGGVNNDPDKGSGGFLYTPPREDFDGASVLLPDMTGEKNPYAQIQFFSEILFENRGFLTNPPKVTILNTTKKEGVANTTAQHLMKYGILVAPVSNAEAGTPREVTTVEYWDTPEIAALIPVLQRKISAVFTPIKPPLPSPSTASNAPEVSSAPQSPITIYIGNDFSTHPTRGTLLRVPLTKKEEVVEVPVEEELKIKN